VFRDVILSEAKNLATKRINYLRDPTSPSAPQDDTLWAFFSKLLDVHLEAAGSAGGYEMGMSWRAIIAALGTAAGLVRSAKNLRETVADLGETRKAPSPPSAGPGNPAAAAVEELRARLEMLEANEARQAELIAKMADQDQALWNQLQHLAARVDKILWIALVALIFSSVLILREIIRLFF
jgi:hypothetical protein